jgi:hypothetical protein
MKDMAVDDFFWASMLRMETSERAQVGREIVGGGIQATPQEHRFWQRIRDGLRGAFGNRSDLGVRMDLQHGRVCESGLFHTDRA